jgi:RsiW-degrading membrane proteinase PrsW (M82 family)
VSAIIRQLTIGMPDLLAAVMVAPPVEEILKIAIPIMVLEHRAHWLSRGKDLVWFAIGSALVFSVVENLLYMFVYLESPSAELLLWRWTACTAMHVAATGLSGVGLMRAYERGLRTNQKPRFAWEWRWLVGAIAVHMAYNAYAISSVPF